MVQTRERARLARLAAIPASFALKSPLQIKYDQVVSRIGKKWPRGFGSSRSRGIRGNGFNCYQNSALQAFMHQPAFLNWIMTHNKPIPNSRSNGVINPCSANPPAYFLSAVPPTCAACAFKVLINTYWNLNPPSDPIPCTAPGVVGLVQIGYDSGEFQRGLQLDANDFYNLLQIRTAVATASPQNQAVQNQAVQNQPPPNQPPPKQPPPNQAPPNQPPQNPPITWEGQYKALYHIRAPSTFVCHLCSHSRSGPILDEPSLILHTRQNSTSLLNELLALFDDDLVVACTNCNVNLARQHMAYRIEAAPHILKINLNIMNGGNATGSIQWKIRAGINVLNTLDLTHLQTHNSLPLTYKLSSVIAHEGSGRTGHYLATCRGPKDVISSLADAQREVVTQAHLTRNPQRIGTWSGDFNVHTATYIRDESQWTAAQRRLAQMVVTDLSYTNVLAGTFSSLY
ncbi:hypothetical protein BDV95DRAFT_663376 [Massariosphaeria phaeospora]|uniref:USP domain-containing protein n=1 Tax=Massariosphaeria phaeospora TaxID=100035 RepID=A0A7C8IF87_9PLEO|nr:hypothetical protein BDV95DRAFT_663376 [Massariosphaeria phaeospora]